MAMVNNPYIQARDQATTAFVNSEAARIESRVRPEVLKRIRYPDLVYVDTEAMGPYDESLVSYISRPGSGRMQPIADGALDFPRVEIEYDSFNRQAYASGIAYGWNDQEIGRARMMNRPLGADKVRAAFRAAEEEKERVVISGNATYGWPGLTNLTGVTGTKTVAASSTWGAGDSLVAYQTIKDAFMKVYIDSKHTFMPDTLLLPASAGSFLYNPMTRGADGIVAMSVKQYLEMNNPYTAETGRPMNIYTLTELDGTGKGVMYDSSQDAVRFLVAQDIFFDGPQREAFNNVWYGYMRLGGLQILQPGAFCEITGIGNAN